MIIQMTMNMMIIDFVLVVDLVIVNVVNLNVVFKTLLAPSMKKKTGHNDATNSSVFV